MENWIVVVDDEALSLANAKTLLGRENMKVSCLRSGKDLLKFMEKNNPDLILLDIMMPEMDGFDTYTALRERESETGRAVVPVIFLTGENDSETEQRGLKLGASDYIRKPFDRDILLSRIHNVIEKSKTIESLREEASLDKLTGCLNKAKGTEKITDLCEERTGALVILDLDNFKLVNDLFGHDMGDKILISFASIIQSSTRSDDLVCRIGGDEFMAFFCNISEETAVAALTRRLNEGITRAAAELLGPEHGIPLGISVGAAFAPEHGRDYNTLFTMADQAMYLVKKSGKRGSAVYSPESNGAGSGPDPEEELKRVTKIVEERHVNSSPLILGTEAFSVLYRYIMRFNNRYDSKALKLIFIVTPKAEGPGNNIQALSDAFSSVLLSTLRRSDIILQTRVNHFFLLLPMLSEPDGQRILERIMENWAGKAESSQAEISYALEMT